MRKGDRTTILCELVQHMFVYKNEKEKHQNPTPVVRPGHLRRRHLLLRTIKKTK